LRVAIVHYWLVNMRGGEKVVEALCELFPTADIFTHVYDAKAVSSVIRGHRINTSFIQKLPKAIRYYKSYLPLMPIALEQLDLRDYDLVISSESGPAKGVLVSAEALHVCYCHTPMRYLWDMYHEYYGGAGRFTRLLMPPLAHYLRLYDQMSAVRVDHFIANSWNVAKRISRVYRRKASVIPPPVDTSAFMSMSEQADFYLMVGQLVRYKRADLAVEAFNKMGKPLVIIGEGELLPKLKKLALKNIKIMGHQPLSVIRDHYARCRALIFPGEEDFGIVPVEAMASGRPVIAYGKGGALETVVDGVTGFFFDDQTVDSLMAAVERYEMEGGRLSSETIIEHARRYDKRIFKERMDLSIRGFINDREKVRVDASY